MNSDEAIFNEGRKSKFGDILRRPRDDIEISIYSPDIEFIYEDSDSINSELAELYSYTEEPEYIDNLKCFEELATKYIGTSKWKDVVQEKRYNFMHRLIDLMDVSDAATRITAIRSALYLCQGTFKECDDVDDNLEETRKNVFLMQECGMFTTCVSLLVMEIYNQNQSIAASQKPVTSIADSLDIRCLMNIIYTMIEVIRRVKENDTQEIKVQRENFKCELAVPVYGESSLLVVLFEMMTKFCSGTSPQFPMKKTLLLIWKIILTILGGLDTIHEQKNSLRESLNLPPLRENPNEVCKHMRASSPPASATDFIEQHQQIKRRPPLQKSGLLKQTSLDSDMELNMEDESYEEGAVNTSQIVGEESTTNFNRPSTPLRVRGLPWAPKVRQKDLENFLEQTRNKFVGFYVKNDITSLIGLPQPIYEGVKVLNQHLYVSLSELQIKREEEISRNPLSMAEGAIQETATEILYRSNYASLPQYMISLLKILLASAPTSKTKSESVNILSDLLPDEMPTSVLQSMKLGMDVNRHKEIIVKAISAIILLLLKHLKLNHIYQFEFMSQHLVFANCVPLVLKFFNQNISSYVTAKNTIPQSDFPNCVVGETSEITAETLEAGDNQQYCWRNLFASINLLRILNKLTKWKHSRTMMLVVFKSAPILKRALKVRQPMMQLYILKLLKMQTKYLGRQWRKSNMKTMSAIYQKVRHRLTDDWAYGNDVDARPWDFQAEESSLRNAVEKFNSRRYDPNSTSNLDFEPVDNCLQSVLSQSIDLPADFGKNYESWLEAEVFNNRIKWEQVLKC